MKALRLLLLGLSLVTLAGLAGCGGNGGGILAAQSNLAQALSFAPTNAGSVSFTDWTLLKQYDGGQSLTSKSDYQARLNFYLAVSRDQGTASFYDAAYTIVQDWAKLWGWDTSDLLWEATLQDPLPPAYVLKVRSDLDLNPIMSRFTSRGFSSSAYQGATVYSHPLDLTVGWYNDTSIFNAAVLPSEHVIILSSAANAVRSVLDAHANVSSSLAGDAAIQAVASDLGPQASAIVTTASSVCPNVDKVGDRDPLAQDQQLLASAGTLHSYSALGIAYKQAQGQPAGLIDLRFGAGQDAQADENARKSLASNAVTAFDGVAYSQALFTVDSASVAGSSLLFKVQPFGNKPQRLFDMFEAGDLLFAACP